MIDVLEIKLNVFYQLFFLTLDFLLNDQVCQKLVFFLLF